MAVFTSLDSNDIGAILEHYEIGALRRFEGIIAGVENTNYHIFTDQGRYVLTVHEGKVQEDDLPFFFGLINHLSDQGLRVNKTLPQKSGQLYGHIQGKTYAISEFLAGAGTDLDDIIVDQCTKIGALLGEMHQLGQDYSGERLNKMSIDVWQRLWGKTKAQADSVIDGIAELVEEEFASIGALWPRLASMDLRKSAVHCDLFADNVFFDGGEVSGVIDFYYACTEYWVYDLALTVNAWCFDSRARFIAERYQALLKAYQAQCPLTQAEQEVLNIMLRASALRILMTRLHDYLFHPGDDQVVPHDPKAFYQRLIHWREETI